MLSFLAILVLLVVQTVAQTSEQPRPSTPPAPSSTRTSSVSTSSSSSEEPKTITVAVGASGHKFTKETVSANVGDVIEFVFYPANHSVIRAEFGFPCTPYEYIDIGRQGFYSGFYPVQAITNDLPRYHLKVNDTQPIFYYCGADGSCYKNKMIGVINPNTTQTLEAQLEAAEGLTFQILPGEPFPDESGFPEPPRPTPSSGRGSDDGSGSDDTDSSAGGGPALSAGQIAGIAIGGAAVVIIAIVLIYLCGRRGGLDTAHRRDTYHRPQNVGEAHYPFSPKSPGTDSRWSAAHWSMKSHSIEPGRDPNNPHTLMAMRGSPVSSTTHPVSGYGLAHSMVEMQHTGQSLDPRMARHSSPPAGPPQPPVELPTVAESPCQRQYSWAGDDSETQYRPLGPG